MDGRKLEAKRPDARIYLRTYVPLPKKLLKMEQKRACLKSIQISNENAVIQSTLL